MIQPTGFETENLQIFSLRKSHIIGHQSREMIRPTMAHPICVPRVPINKAINKSTANSPFLGFLGDVPGSFPWL